MKAILACLALAISLIGCNGKTNIPFQGNNSNGQSTPVQSTPLPTIIPTPLESKGTVVGTLVSDSPGKSLAGLTLYFGTVLPLTPGPDHLVNLDVANAPNTVISNDGRFIAANITPGQYVMVLWTPHDARYIPDPKDTQKDLVLEVVSGKILDLGVLQVSSPQ
jgi:hypothetical protein